METTSYECLHAGYACWTRRRRWKQRTFKRLSFQHVRTYYYLVYISIYDVSIYRQRDRLEDLIRNLTAEKRKIGEVMVFCIEHSEAADEIAECIFESLSNPATMIYKKISRFYLISDILHNCGVKINNASYYRKA